MKFVFLPVIRALNKASRKVKVLRVVIDLFKALLTRLPGRAKAKESKENAENHFSDRELSSPVCYADAPEVRDEYRD